MLILLVLPTIAHAEFKATAMREVPTDNVQEIVESYKELDNAKGTFIVDQGNSKHVVVAVMYDNVLDVCGEITSGLCPKSNEDIRQECAGTLSQAKYIDPNALALCIVGLGGGASNTCRFTFVQKCLENIVNKRFSTDEVNFCANAERTYSRAPSDVQATCMGERGK